MTTLELNWCVTIIIHILQTNNAFRVQTKLFTLFCTMLLIFIKTIFTVFAVLKFTFGTFMAQITLLTMIQLLDLALLVVEGAMGAEVGREVFVAPATCTLLILHFVTAETLYFRHCKPVHVMIFVGVEFVFKVDSVVAQTTRIECSFANGVGTLKLACAI